MIKFIFRIALFGLGLFVCYSFGNSFIKPLMYRFSGEKVEGKIVGFLAGRYGPSVQQKSTGVRNGKRISRRPVFRYPITLGSKDSVTSRSDVAPFFSFTQYELGETVTVVFPKNDPQNGYIYGFQLILMDLLVLCLGIFMLYIGIGGKS